MSDLERKLKEIKARLEEYKRRIESDDDDDGNGNMEELKEAFVAKLRSLCGLIRDTEGTYDRHLRPGLLNDILVEAEGILKDSLRFAYGSDQELWDFFPSFADTPDSNVSPLVKDRLYDNISQLGSKLELLLTTSNL